MKINSVILFGFLTPMLFCETVNSTPETPLPLNVKQSLLVEWLAEPNKTYQVETSIDLKAWVPVGNPALGSGKMENRCFVNESGKRFWRVLSVENVLIPWLEGSWRGLVNQPRQGTSNYMTTLTVSSDESLFRVVYSIPGEAVLELISFNDTEAEFLLKAENIINGPIEEGVIYIRKGNNEEILYNWVNANYQLVRTSFGVLSRQ